MIMRMNIKIRVSFYISCCETMFVTVAKDNSSSYVLNQVVLLELIFERRPNVRLDLCRFCCANLVVRQKRNTEYNWGLELSKIKIRISKK